MAAKVGQVIVDFLLNTAKFEDDIKKVTKSFKQMGRDLTEAGKSLTAEITLPIVAAGAAVIKFANDMDEGMDKIRSKTGATGEAFTALGDSMRNVMANVPQGVTDVSEAISDLNVRLGLTGVPLETMATQMLNLARITGTEVGPLITAATRLFGDWSVATDQQSSTLDYLYKVSQETGIGVNQLMETVVQFGAPLRSLGFDVETAAAMMGKWEKEGVNMETALAGLRKGLGTFAKAGLDSSAALATVEKAIKGAKTESEAMTIAIKAFGAKAGPDLARAILEGRMSVEELKASIKGSGDTINKAAADTMSFSEKMGLLGNKIALAAEPLGNALLKAFNAIMPYIEKAVEYLAKLADWFSKLPAPVQGVVIAITALAAATGPVLLALGMMATGIGSLLPLLTKAAAAIGAAGFAGAITAMGWAAAAVGAFWVGWKLGELLDKIGFVNAAGNKLAEWIVKIPGVAANSSTALKDLEGTTQRLADKLKTLGVNVDRLAGESIEAWSRRVIDASKAHADLKPKVEGVSTATTNLKKPVDAAAFSLDSLGKKGKSATDELKKLKEETEKALSPMDELAEKLDKQMKLGFSKSDLVAKYKDQIINAAREQVAITGEISETSVKFIDQAMQLNFNEKAYADYLAVLKLITPSQEDVTESTLKTIRALTAEDQVLGILNNSIKDNRTSLEKLTDEEDSTKAAMDGLTKSALEAGEELERQDEAAKALGKSIAQELGGAVDRLGSSLAANIIDWRGWKDTIIGFGKDIASTLLTSFLDGFLSPLKSALSSFGQGFGNWLTRLFSGGGAGGFNPIGWLTEGLKGGNGGWLGGLLGIGASTGSAFATTTAATGVPSIMGPLFAGSAGLAGAGGTAAIAGGGAAAGGGGILASIGAFATNPITLAVAGGIAAVFAGLKLADWVSGPNSWEAGSKEAARDFGNVGIAPDAIKALAEAIGISEEQAWGIRKDLLSSPQALQAMYALAEQQGKTADFLASLSRVETSWGTFNFKDAFEKGLQTGIWNDLNTAYKDAFEHSQRLAELIPDITKLFAQNDPNADITGAGDTTITSTTSTANSERFGNMERSLSSIDANTRNPVSVRSGDIYISINTTDSGEDLVQMVKRKIIPILNQEMTGGNTGMREAVRASYDRTRGAY